MQLYALDKNYLHVFAKNASKHQNYTCLECQSTVRLRGGMHRQNHFYHLDLKRSCRQNGKSMQHLHVQLFLQRELLEKNCTVEKRFDEIKRVADLFWHPFNIVFEVQCSPISLEEVKARESDYATLGIQVIWILHERQFNQSRFSAVQQHLQYLPRYFTNMDSEGNGMIYDQFQIYHKGRKLLASRPFPIDVTSLFSVRHPIPHKMDLPESFIKKIISSKIYFKGDLIDYCYSERFSKDFFAKAFQILKQIKPPLLTPFQKLLYFFKTFGLRPYKLFLRILLEKASF